MYRWNNLTISELLFIIMCQYIMNNDQLKEKTIIFCELSSSQFYKIIDAFLFNF